MSARQMALEALKEMVELAQMTIGWGFTSVPEGADGPLPNALKAIAALEAEIAALAVEPVTREALLGAIARGWCSPKNSHKEMDSDLALAIVDEVVKLYTAPTSAAPEPVNAELLATCRKAVCAVAFAAEYDSVYQAIYDDLDMAITKATS